MKNQSKVALAASIYACTFFPLLAQANSFDSERIARLLPPGCTPREDVDIFTGGVLGIQKGSRNEITCRERVPAAVWPHEDVPIPHWPKAQPVPHQLDLASATNKGDGSATDRIGSAYFDHLCKTESGVWFYRRETGPQPASVINLRPREDVSTNTALMYDRYWLEAGGLTASLMYEFSYRYVGNRPYRDPRDPVTDKLPGDIYEREIDPVTKKPLAWLRTDPPRALEPIWFAWEKTPGAITFVERPLVPANQLPNERLAYKADGFKLLRFSYAPLEGFRTVRLASGREVLVRKADPAPEQCIGDNWMKYDLSSPDMPQGLATGQRACWNKFGSQRLVVTPTNESKAHYGYVWREVLRSEHDLRLGITGAEVMVVDMKTGETIGLHRSFRQMSPVKPYLPSRTSVRIDNARYQCIDRNHQLRKTGNGFVAAAIGADPAWKDARRSYEPLEVSPRPEAGDVLETQ